MELFFANIINESAATISGDEFRHCVKVLRHKQGDTISFIDGNGGLYSGKITGIASGECNVQIISHTTDYAKRDYFLHIAVAPTKNLERYEWFMEKATEIGIDELTPIIGEHSERKIFKPERGERIILSAVKQSLKANIPVLNPVISVKDFIKANAGFDGIKLIAHCNEGVRQNITSVLPKDCRFLIMIGPEGDFSPSEVELAMKNGFIPISLGESRLRTETAALTVVTATYLLTSNF